MTLQPFGDRALLINWEQRIDPELNATVHAWKQAIEQAAIKGVEYSIPAYCSLTVVFNPLQIAFETLAEKIQALKIPEPSNGHAGRTIEIPVNYNGADLPEVAQRTGLSLPEIISLHSNRPYRVYLIGFLPGFPYLGPLPEALHCPRKQTPRQSVPAGAVGLAGAQTGIYPFEAPGGWQIIGRTLLKVFDAQARDPFLLRPGDTVIFKPV
jgi:inhibitor of KinA